jgi:hypothetical protein
MIFFLQSNLSSETIELPQAFVSPIVEPIQPNKQYRTGETVVYQIQVHWPKFKEDIRLNSPEIATENLEFIGMSQEIVSGAENERVNQLLSFKFVTQKPGPAKVNPFPLRWTYGEGIQTTEVSVPGLELTVTRSVSELLKQVSFLVSIGFLVVTGMFLLFARLRKKEAAPNVSLNPFEESALNELEKIKNEWQSSGPNADFLSDLSRVFNRYLEQKLGWNPAKASYNDVKKLIEEKWSKKEASELKELIDQLEQIRFSEGAKDQKTLDQFYFTISSFIERRKIS